MSGLPVTSGVPSAPTGVLRTNLTVPCLWPGALRRSVLVDHLNGAGVPGRLTLMVAGAGWGKSTLLAQWHNQDPHPQRFAWLSIEAADNDPTRFWVYVLAALDPLGEGLCAHCRPGCCQRPGRPRSMTSCPH